MPYIHKCYGVNAQEPPYNRVIITGLHHTVHLQLIHWINRSFTLILDMAREARLVIIGGQAFQLFAKGRVMLRPEQRACAIINMISLTMIYILAAWARKFKP